MVAPDVSGRKLPWLMTDCVVDTDVALPFHSPHTILTFVFMEKLQDLVNWRAVGAQPVEIKV